jgi:hypothetical protein
MLTKSMNHGRSSIYQHIDIEFYDQMNVLLIDLWTEEAGQSIIAEGNL